MYLLLIISAEPQTGDQREISQDSTGDHDDDYVLKVFCIYFPLFVMEHGVCV